MFSPQEIVELWGLRIDPSDLSNIERPRGEGPATGGGQLYIQVNLPRTADLLRFLDAEYPEDRPLEVTVRNIGTEGTADLVQFDKKSEGRMRIPNQNRHRARRVRAWSPEVGFPHLPESEASTQDAKALISSLGGLHIFLARDKNGTIWAGYTTGSVDPKYGFAPVVSGDSEGGYWRYESEDDE